MDLSLARPERLLRSAGAVFQAEETAQASSLAGVHQGLKRSSGPARRTGGWGLVLLCLAGFSLAEARAAVLTPATAAAWDRYYRWADEKAAQEIKDPQKFLVQDRLSPQQKNEVQRRLKAGQTYIDRVTGVVPPNEKFSVPDGEIHHWWGTVLVPRVKLPELMKFLQDYDHHGGKFADVIQSRLISKDGNHFTFFFKLSRSKAVVTANYNSIQEATYYPVDSRRVWSKSIATKIAELENPGTPQEKERPPGDDRGFLWRLVSWWRFQETDDGVIIEIESASLSTSIPWWVKWIPGVASYIRSTPKESMESVLISIRQQFTSPK